MDSTQRKILQVAVAAALVLVSASFVMTHPPESGIHWTLAGVGLVQGKGHMFLVVRDFLQVELPRLVAAALVSLTFIALAAFVASVIACARRLASKT